MRNVRNQKQNLRAAFIVPLLGVGILAEAWGLMIIVGMMHIHWIPELPTLGYALAVAIVFVKFLATVVSAIAANMIKSIISDY